jgi:hypothetical protein
MTNKEEIAKLKQELAELKAVVPKPQKSWEEMERENREWISQMHELREGRMAYAVHPSVVRDMAGGVTEADCADLRRASHCPSGPSPMSPSAPPVTTGRSANVPGGGTGWAHSAPLGPPPGVAQADRLMDAQDAKDRAELIREEAQRRAMQKLADRTEALGKLAEQKK